MKGRIVVPALAVLAILVLLSSVGRAQAGIEPVLAINHVYDALNSGDVDAAAAVFAADVTAENLVRGETYRGASGIRQMLQGMLRANRQFEIVNVQMDGDTITAKVEVSDGSLAWGTETIEAVVKDGRLQSFTVTAFRLEVWRIRQVSPEP